MSKHIKRIGTSGHIVGIGPVRHGQVYEPSDAITKHAAKHADQWAETDEPVSTGAPPAKGPHKPEVFPKGIIVGQKAKPEETKPKETVEETKQEETLPPPPPPPPESEPPKKEAKLEGLRRR